MVTLQFGNYANFVGAHFWNFQDELLGRAEATTTSPSGNAGPSSGLLDVESDVLFRVGETQQVICLLAGYLCMSINLRGLLHSLLDTTVNQMLTCLILVSILVAQLHLCCSSSCCGSNCCNDGSKQLGRPFMDNPIFDLSSLE